ncbi:sigma-70 family RNA polymerase sigma factor [Pseudoclavibacter chungangensis]|uniref:Sigma-70 family RNA polymerase sigma factor n=1 Tax=Pseudoclavibacter chungangensis TaxID=587635 RepID=A0A7J5C2H1_9MICO|nr:sigma-70 family RNA polymerase sigma factor [Pseudoclavibacter chungangensis]
MGGRLAGRRIDEQRHARDSSREPEPGKRATTDVTTDSDIIRRSLQHPPRFGELFERHAESIAAYATSRVGVGAADDVLSETFLVAFERRERFDHAWSSARPWLFGIATRLIRKHRAREAQQWRAWEAGAAAAVAGESGIESVGSRVDAWARVRDLAPEIARLSARDRATLLLYAWGDLSYQEVAAAVGVPVGTVRSRLNGVRKRLGEAGPEYDEWRIDGPGRRTADAEGPSRDREEQGTWIR